MVRWPGRSILLILTALLVAAIGVPAAATAKAPAPIRGALSAPGYTVIAMAANGEARTASAPNGTFVLVPPAETVTLHLRAPDGTYAGPIVLMRKGDTLKRAKAQLRKARRAPARAKAKLAAARRSAKQARGRRSSRIARERMKRAAARLAKARRTLRRARRHLAWKQRWAALGVRAGARLGRIAVKTSAGYGLTRGLGKRAWRSAVTGVRATAVNGVPIGAGNVGLVSTSAHGSGDDTDLDGVPNPLDIDDDGDLVLDEYDPTGGAGASDVGGTFPSGSRIQVNPLLQTHETGTTNVDGGSSAEQIAATQTEYGELNIFWLGIDPGSGELDCGQLVYCSAGGTGRLRTSDVDPFRSSASPFPACCDADGDGLGSLTSTPNLTGAGTPDSGGMDLFPGASNDQIGTGDVLIERSTVNGVAGESVTTMGFAFSTPPALASYDDGQGDSATFTYPRPEPVQPTPVRAGPGGDVVLSLTLWRPQRRHVEGDPGSGAWTDMGSLAHMITAFVPSAGPSYSSTVACPQSTLSETDPHLEPVASSPYAHPYPDAGGFRDTLGDQPSDPANTFSYRVNLTQCLASKGVTLAANDDVYLGFLALAPQENRLASAVSSLQIRVQE